VRDLELRVRYSYVSQGRSFTPRTFTASIGTPAMRSVSTKTNDPMPPPTLTMAVSTTGNARPRHHLVGPRVGGQQVRRQVADR
jgi:hypothetical protein